MEKVYSNYNFSIIETILFAMEEDHSYSTLNKLKTELNKFFVKAKCNGIIYTNPQNPVHIQSQTLAKVRSFGAKFDGGNIALRFEIPAAAAVKFSLADMQGRVVRAFNLGNRTAGTHFETRSVENLPRGRYVGVLQVNGKATEKTMLLKK